MFLLLLLIPSLVISSIVHTPYGEVEGFEHATDRGVEAQIFLGIRYGQSTNGTRRFQKPEMVDKWTPNRIIANEFGPSCISYTPGIVPGVTYSEDCLFLNIIAPKHRDGNLPIFFYIHGGFYEVGSSTYFGYKRFADTFASNGVIVVSINYRLGPFGFFSLGDPSSASNMGLWDQTVALAFVHEILPSFGGDVTRITVGGHSAGSASSSALQYSPHSNSLFSQSILLSGSSLAEFAQSEWVVDESKKLLEAFDCPLLSTQDALECLRKRSPIEIIETVERLGSTRKHPNVVTYNPRIDGDFFPHSIPELARNAPKKRILAGATDQESALFVVNEEMGWIAAIALTEEEQKSFSRKDLIDFIDKVVTDKEFVESAAFLRSLLVDFYAGSEGEKKDTKFYVQRYSDLNSDLQFLIPLYQEIQLALDNEWPSYLYILQHVTKSYQRETKAVQGMYHGDELEHFTDSFVLLPLKDEEEDKAFGINFVAAMVNFIKNGDPSSSFFSWPPISKENPFQHASITSNITLKKEAYRLEAARLWLESIPKSVLESLRKTRLPGAEAHVVHTEL